MTRGLTALSLHYFCETATVSLAPFSYISWLAGFSPNAFPRNALHWWFIITEYGISSLKLKKALQRRDTQDGSWTGKYVIEFTQKRLIKHAFEIAFFFSRGKDNL